MESEAAMFVVLQNGGLAKEKIRGGGGLTVIKI